MGSSCARCYVRPDRRASPVAAPTVGLSRRRRTPCPCGVAGPTTPLGRGAGRAGVTLYLEEESMPQGDKSSYTDKQKRQAEHIAEGYSRRGVGKKTAKSRAWATVNAMTGGGKKSGSGRGKKVNKAPAKKGGKKGAQAAAKRSSAAKSASAKKAAKTRARKK